jgi:hypothetical protein
MMWRGHWVVNPQCVPVHGVVYTPCNGVGHVSAFSLFPGGMSTASPRAVSLYWLIALPLAYLVIAWWYRRRAQRRGVSTSPVAYVVTGLALVALLVATSQGALSWLTPGPHSRLRWLFPGASVLGLGDLGIRGLLPLLTVSIALFVLAYCERSRPLAEFAVSLLALSLLVNLYDLQNVAYRLGIMVGPEIGVFVVGLYLLGGGLAFAAAHRRAVAV